MLGVKLAYPNALDVAGSGWVVRCLMSAAGIVAAALGYTYLAEENAMVAAVGSIAATAWIALARILEAPLVTGVHVGSTCRAQCTS
jgi:hypothetical protein